MDSLSELSGYEVSAFIEIAESEAIAVTASGTEENSPKLLLLLNPDPDTIPINLSSNHRFRCVCKRIHPIQF